MDLIITPGKLSGTIAAIPSKSQAHRLLICAAFADAPTTLLCPETNRDIEATADCLNALGASIVRTAEGYQVEPVRSIPEAAILNCCESGSTLRFMLPIAAALGVDTVFQMAGRLPQRPLSPLWEEMERMGAFLTRPTPDTIRSTGKLRSGTYTIDGGVSSQFITGLLFALSLIDGGGKLHITGKIESLPYIEMTQRAMEIFGISTADYVVAPGQRYISPGKWTVEGDWSNGAFFLAARAMGNPVETGSLNPDSPQGDRAVADILARLDEDITIDVAHTPDLVPILAVVAGFKHGCTFENIQRLRLKETDRVATVCAMLNALGAKATATESSLRIDPAPYRGCTIDGTGDHRIAMAGAIAATVASGPVTIIGAESVNKSYPAFWAEYARLGGKI